MQTRTDIRHLLTVTIVAAVLAASTLNGFAADEPAPPKAPRQPAPPANIPPKPAEPGTPGYNLIIRNGELISDGFFGNNGSRKTSNNKPATLENVLDKLRENYTAANIVVSPGLGEVLISDLKLRAQSLPDELEAIRVASGNRFDWTGPAVGLIDPTTGLPIGQAGPPDSGLFVLREPAQTAQNERVVEAFNLGPYLKKVVPPDSKNEEGAVQTEIAKLKVIMLDTAKTLQQDFDANHTSFQFHRGGNLLIVVGPKVVVEVAGKVVNALTGGGGNVRLDAGRGELEHAKAAMQYTEMRMKQAQLQMDAEMKAMEEMEKAVKAGNNEKVKALLQKQMEMVKKQLEQIQSAEKAYVGDNP